MVHALAIAALILSVEPGLPLRDEPAKVPSEDDESLLLETVAAHRNELKVCADKDATSEQTRFVLIWDIATNGSVTNIGVSEDAFSTHLIVRCIADVIAKLRFPRKLSKLKTVSMPFLSGQPTEPALPVREVPRLVPERFMQFAKVFQSHKAELANCLLTSPKDQRVVFTLIWDVAVDGAVSNVGVDQPVFAREPAAVCIAKKMGAWKFASSDVAHTDSLRIRSGGRDEDVDYFDSASR